MLIDTVRCEVYNASYEPLTPVSARRALRLHLQGKATIVEHHPSQRVNSETGSYPIPTRIVMNYMVKGIRQTHVRLTQRNLFIRDNFTCQYCLRHKSELGKKESLTRDHVIPRDLGGPDEWENVVTACNKCNNRKANKPLRETGMKLNRDPFMPSRWDIWNKNKQKNPFTVA